MENQAPQPPFVKGFGYTVLGNLVFLLLYSAIFLILENSHRNLFSTDVFFASFVHAAMYLLISIGCLFAKRPGLGLGILLSALVVPLIGFSICMVGLPPPPH
jgi:hypothetical protein